jgi:hypothetical protein
MFSNGGGSRGSSYGRGSVFGSVSGLVTLLLPLARLLLLPSLQSGGKEEWGAESVGLLLLLPLQAERSLCICCPVSKIKCVYVLFVSQHGM